MDYEQMKKEHPDAFVIGEFLKYCCYIYNQYNREPGDLEYTIPVFCLVLEDYKLSEIKKAFSEYFRTGKQMPVPADIVDIIELGKLKEVLVTS